MSIPPEQGSTVAPEALDPHLGPDFPAEIEIPTATSLQRKRGKLSLRLSIGWLVLVFFVAIFADVLPIQPYDTLIEGMGPREEPHLSFTEPLGTDSIGRSMTSRLIYGARQSLTVGVVAVALAMSAGMIIGMLAGFLRGKVDEIITIFLDSILSIPSLVLLIALASVGQRSLQMVIIGLAIVVTPTFSRLSRANTLAVADREYVVAARSMGAGNFRIVFREIFPSVVFPVSSYAFLVFATLMVAEGSLSFLGLGIPPPKPSWGGMVNEGRGYLSTQPYLVFVPSACLLFTVLSFTIVGDRARRHFDTRESALA